MWYGIAADALVGLHLVYVAYVIVGQIAIVIAAPMKWQWARNPWFRFSHLIAIVFVAFEEFAGMRCPLTVWEEQLRAMGGQTFSGSETFMGRMFHDLLFSETTPHIVYAVGHVAMAVLVLQAFIMYPPRWFRFGKKKTEAMTPEGTKVETALTDTKEQSPAEVSK